MNVRACFHEVFPLRRKILADRIGAVIFTSHLSFSTLPPEPLFYYDITSAQSWHKYAIVSKWLAQEKWLPPFMKGFLKVVRQLYDFCQYSYKPKKET